MIGLPVSKKERLGRGKNGFSPRMKNGHANLMRKNAFTNGGSSVSRGRGEKCVVMSPLRVTLFNAMELKV